VTKAQLDEVERRYQETLKGIEDLDYSKDQEDE
jgi:hypothetical protein